MSKPTAKILPFKQPYRDEIIRDWFDFLVLSVVDPVYPKDRDGHQFAE